MGVGCHALSGTPGLCTPLCIPVLNSAAAADARPRLPNACADTPTPARPPARVHTLVDVPARWHTCGTHAHAHRRVRISQFARQSIPVRVSIGGPYVAHSAYCGRGRGRAAARRDEPRRPRREGRFQGTHVGDYSLWPVSGPVVGRCRRPLSHCRRLRSASHRTPPPLPLRAYTPPSTCYIPRALGSMHARRGCPR